MKTPSENADKYTEKPQRNHRETTEKPQRKFIETVMLRKFYGKFKEKD